MGGGKSISGMENSMYTDPKVREELLARVEVSQGIGISVGLEV